MEDLKQSIPKITKCVENFKNYLQYSKEIIQYVNTGKKGLLRIIYEKLKESIINGSASPINKLLSLYLLAECTKTSTKLFESMMSNDEDLLDKLHKDGSVDIDKPFNWLNGMNSSKQMI